ncbi:FHA domain-containing protein [Oceanidesulfovibrio indonesiensis]|nr:FHA domain-containing protein [Oceanidesulfovibrio indonesiensis]
MADTDKAHTSKGQAEVKSPAVGTLVLVYDDQRIEIGPDKDMPRKASLGRDSSSQIVIPYNYVSRRHASVELLRDRYVFTDHSANGTYIHPEDGEPTLVHGGKAFLEGSGTMSLGQSQIDEIKHVVHYEIIK